MLHPELSAPARFAALQAEWAAKGSLRIAPFLAPERARALLDAVRAEPHALRAVPAGTGLSMAYWQLGYQPEPACEHTLCAFGEWLWGEGTAWIARLTGLALAPPAERQLVATCYTKGSYLDAHNDHDGARQVAFVLGLTEAEWPPERGGHLEFLAMDEHGARVVERRPPGWNTLDLFDVRGLDRAHRVPLVRDPVERRAIIGWLY